MGEDSELSKPASVDLGLFLSDEGIEGLTEVTLSTNKVLADAERLQWKAGDDITMPNWDGGGHTKPSSASGSGGLWLPALQCQGIACLKEGADVELGPMQIRTFVTSSKDGNAASLLRM